MQTRPRFVFSIIALHILFVGAPIAALNLAAAGLAASSATLWMTVTLFLIGWAIIVFWNRDTLGAFKVTPGTRRDWKAAAGAFGLLLLAAGIGRAIDPSFDTLYASRYGLLTISGIISFIAVLPPLLLNEELYARTLQRLVGAHLPKNLTIVLVALNFALLHISLQWPGHIASVLVSVFLAAGALTIFFAASGNLLLAYILHVVYDIAVTIQIHLHASGNRSGELIFWLIAAAIILLTLGYAKALLAEQLQNAGKNLVPARAMWLGLLLIALPIVLRLI